MSRDRSGACLTAVFVDYDNIYLSLKRKNEEAAKRFAKDTHRWVSALASGQLISPINASSGDDVQRRLIMNRCYGNPVPRRNQSDNTTDMSSFPFVRHHFLRGGFEVVDCPPLTAQLKNSADIRMVMDIRDFLTHETHFEEFIILSSDADFTPLLHRLRAHARRIVVFSNDHTALPYAALCDGEVRESALIDLLLEDSAIEADPAPEALEAVTIDPHTARGEVVTEVVRSVLNASAPQPLEALAERAIRVLGHAKTVGTEWGGAGNFRDLLTEDLPASVALTEQAPYFAYDVSRAIARSDHQRIASPAPANVPATNTAIATPQAAVSPKTVETEDDNVKSAPSDAASDAFTPERAATLQDSIAQIHQACKAPPLSPPEYRAVFTLLANEISTNQMQGYQTVDNVRALTAELGIDAKKEDIRFIIDIVGAQDPWFEQGASALVFASRFRNYVIAQCQEEGLQLSADEIDLIDAWFAGNASNAASGEAPKQAAPAHQQAQAAAPAAATSPQADETTTPLGERTARWWQETAAKARDDELTLAGDNDRADEFPRIVRNRLKA